MVGLRTGFLLFNTPFSFSLHFSSNILGIYFESAKAVIKSDFLTVLVCLLITRTVRLYLFRNILLRVIGN